MFGRGLYPLANVSCNATGSVIIYDVYFYIDKKQFYYIGVENFATTNYKTGHNQNARGCRCEYDQ